MYRYNTIQEQIITIIFVISYHTGRVTGGHTATWNNKPVIKIILKKMTNLAAFKNKWEVFSVSDL